MPYLIYPRGPRGGVRVPGYVSGIAPPAAQPPPTNLLQWFDAGSIVGLTDGQALTTWTDKQSGWNATQSTAANKPLYKTNILNGLPGVLFDGSNDWMGSTFGTWGSTLGTVYIVATITDTFYTIYGWRTDEYWYYDATHSYLGTFRNVRLNNVAISWPGTGAHVITIQSSTTSYTVWRDRSSIYSGTASWGIGAGVTLGVAGAGGGDGGTTNSWFSGHIHEILAYNTDHSAAQRAAIWDYFTNRWGLA